MNQLQSVPIPQTQGQSTEPLKRRGIDRAIEFTTRHFSEDLNLTLLARAACMPSNTLTRRFNRAFGMSPMRWVWAFRTMLAAEMIDAAPEWSITAIATHCGFGSNAHFSRRFREILGASPSSYRKTAKSRRLSLQDDERQPVRFFDDAPVIAGRALARVKRLKSKIVAPQS